MTIVRYRRRPYFTDSSTVDLVRLQFLHAGSQLFAIAAYCFMPDHLHALVSGKSSDADFRRFIKLAKQRSSYHFAQACGERLWHHSFFDRTLRPDETDRDAMRYIVMNPVRAGLASTPREYGFWGSELFGREELLDYVGSDA